MQDFRPDGMVHGRVVRPPSYGAQLLECRHRPRREDAGRHQGGARRQLPRGDRRTRIPGHQGHAGAGRRGANGRRRASLPDAGDLPARSDRACRRRTSPILKQKRVAALPPPKTLEATYSRPYQVHGSIGPSCAVAQFESGAVTVWTHTQGVYPDRAAIAEMLACRREQVRCIHSRARAATATTAPTTPRPMPRCWRARCRDGRCACNGCASRSMPGSRSARRWSSR